jgi:hypothetical protein
MGKAIDMLSSAPGIESVKALSRALNTGSMHDTFVLWILVSSPKLHRLASERTVSTQPGEGDWREK